MKKIMLTGLAPEVTEAEIRTAMEKAGQVHSVQIIATESDTSPVVVVVMNLTDQEAYRLTTRVTDYWHDGRIINARLLLH